MWHIAARQYTAENGILNALYIGLALWKVRKTEGFRYLTENKSLITVAFDTGVRHMTHTGKNVPKTIAAHCLKSCRLVLFFVVFNVCD